MGGRAPTDTRPIHEAGIKPLMQEALGVHSLREDRGAESEFVTISYWESVAAMARFTGGDPARIHHLERDPEHPIELPECVHILHIGGVHGDTGGSAG